MHPAADSKEIPNEVVWLLSVLDHILVVEGNNKSMSEKVAFVTGSSSGMGYETSLILARNGFHTIYA